jgi:cysteine desulfurase/selenocysteine lyase
VRAARRVRARERSESGLDVARIRKDFPILERTLRGKPLVYINNAATTQKPRAVIDAVSRYYTSYNSNVLRGLDELTEQATEAFEAARAKAQRFIGAADSREIVFVRGTTEAINLVAQSFARPRLREDDEILITEMEHHSNIVPWQLVCEQTGARLRVLPFDERGELDLGQLDDLLTSRTRIFALTHVSNALGTVNPVRRIIEAARAAGVPVLVDGAQAVPHLGVDVRELGCDFYAFSGHKTYGPTGIGVLYGRAELLDAMPPYQGGGEMIRSVTFERTLYHDIPHKFEAGTPNIAGAIGLGAAIDYLDGIDPAALRAHEETVLAYATEKVSDVPGVHLTGTAREKVSIVSFVMEGVHAHDVGTILDREGVAARAGHHCAQPVMQHFGVPATTRASFGLYNTRQEVDRLVRGLHRVHEIFD